jgi:deazaflavin-dependent oxidoreductase (nitroreductase family)
MVITSQSLRGHHHRLKTFGGWRDIHLADGTVIPPGHLRNRDLTWINRGLLRRWRRYLPIHAAALRRPEQEAWPDLQGHRCWAGRTRAGLFFGHHFSPRLDRWVSRLTNGRGFGSIVNAPLVTTGAKSGQPRQAQVSYFHDGHDPIVIASNYGGPKHPQWSYNLKAHPECQFGGEHFVATEVTDPAEYTRLCALADTVYAGYGDYRVRAGRVGRQIPIFRLKPR